MISKTRRFDAILLALAAFAAYAVKRRFAGSGAEELGWLLSPATSLVELVTLERFAHEARVGFVAVRLPIVIAPGCAGLNFFVISLVTLAFGFLPRIRTRAHKLAWFFACPIVAYASTLLANTARIGAAVALHVSGFHVPVLSPSETHRALGVVVYLGSLWILFLVAERALGFSGRTASRTGRLRTIVVPLAVYLAVALGVPFLNGAGRRAEFWQHAAHVSIIAGALAATACVVGFMSSRRPKAGAHARYLKQRRPPIPVVGAGAFAVR